MSKQASKIFAGARRQQICDIINEKGQVSVTDLCETFEVSPATIRTDLRVLEENGALARVYGGAVAIQSQNLISPNSNLPSANYSTIQAIAQTAVTFVQPGDIIALDSGMTMFEFAKLLTHIDNLTIVTNDLHIVAYLEEKTKVNTIMAGGAVNRQFHCTTGQTAIDTISTLHVDKVFATATGVDIQRGLSTTDMAVANFKSRLIESGDKIFLLADSQKLAKNSFVFYAPLSKADVLVTDDQAPSHFIKAIQQYGLEVVVAQTNH